MDFKLTKTQVLQQELFRKFAETEIKPIAKDMDESEEYDQGLVAKLQKAGMFGIPYSREYGGQGADVLTYTLAMEEVSKVDASTGITLSVHTSLCCPCINEFGTEAQKQEFLRPLVDGHKVGCFGLTEPGAGTDASGVRTEALKDGDDYIINGTKIFTTNSGFADTFIVFALTDKTLGPKGMSAFILDRTMPGITVGENIERMGIRAASNCEVAYENVRVPASRLLGKEGQGYKIAMTALAGGRIGIGAQSVGIAQGAIDEAMKYVKERKQFGKTINKFQNTQFKLAECQTKVDAARLMVWRAATAKDNHENFAPLAAMCKLFGSEVANEVTRVCVQLLGGYGYCREYPVERAMRDAKITEIYEGTSEAMKMIISGAMKV
ncbi:acyl-CoA dehydrogenase family protein [Anaerotignum propionicum]|jgi:butyryl-CoA dehydrogenase|uniref:Acyl-CoA dehydrogenase n=1 Tax=Anaerotignum propionicum DSM 1682 TaxID=991789 RepID=A0A0X8V9U3_ANAPI|nr:acyl-CoA dehydrogenase family protein [Anaerotignum propionicum]AMJ40085.1 acyl-CoA dehydrogenase [Anaerotignum propionicum DSM 1682]MEA5058073.1 acyl-CoA dehydrogenase family protein [Anaerotignum propionicum]SHE80300.1 butyryl-CoA dehydrogenase [[Clostridium] propionicum DSM 1682] [Anaerotignum propionicum DSM 1682]